MSADWMTAESVSSFAGATGATVAIANTAQRAFGFNPKWLALAVATFLSFGIDISGGNFLSQPMLNIVVAAVNGCLVYLAASGGTAAAGQIIEGAPVGSAEALDHETRTPYRTFWQRWS